MIMKHHLVQTDSASSAESSPLHTLSWRGDDTSSTLGCPEVAACVLLVDQASLFGKKRERRKERLCQQKKKKENCERTESCSCFASAIRCFLFTFSGQCLFPEISYFPKACPAPSSPTGHLFTLLADREIHHPKSVSVQFLLLAAREGVLFALPKCSRGLMLRCYVQTISAVMNHVLPPLCFYSCTRLFFFFFQANTFEFPCLPLKRCTPGTQRKLSYSYRPEISKPTSRSLSFCTTKGKLIQHSLK